MGAGVTASWTTGTCCAAQRGSGHVRVRLTPSLEARTGQKGVSPSKPAAERGRGLLPPWTQVRAAAHTVRFRVSRPWAADLGTSQPPSLCEPIPRRHVLTLLWKTHAKTCVFINKEKNQNHIYSMIPIFTILCVETHIRGNQFREKQSKIPLWSH